MALTQVSRGLLSTSIVDNGNATAITIDANENVGIGTGSPVTLKSSTTLQVSGNAKLGDDNGRGLLSLGDISSTGANAGIWRGAAGAYAGTGNYLNLGGYDGITFTTGNADISSQTERMRIDASGNVDITIGNLFTDATSGIFFSGGIGSFTNGIYGVGVNNVAINAGGSERMRIDSSGNVGIGTSSVSNTLHVQTSNSGATPFSSSPLVIERNDVNLISMLSANDTDQGILFGDVADNDIGGLFYLHASNAMTFRTNTAERMRIDASGNVIAGGTTAQASNAVTLMQDGEVTAAGFYFSNNIGSAMNDTGIRRATTNTMVFDTAGTERMRIDGSGNLLVGTTSQLVTEKVSISVTSGSQGIVIAQTDNANAHDKIIFTNTNGVVGYIRTTGTTTAYATSSDQRLKENIVDAPSASDDIDAIQVRSFDWKADGSHQKYGMVAQELNTVAPVAVSVPEDPNEMMGVDYSKLVPMLVKEIQSLRARVQQLENN